MFKIILIYHSNIYNGLLSQLRWKLVDTEELPDFMKICLSFLYKITNDFAEKVYKKHRLNPIDTLKKSVK